MVVLVGLDVGLEIDVPDGISVGQDEVLSEQSLGVQIAHGVAKRAAILTDDGPDLHLRLFAPLGSGKIVLDEVGVRRAENEGLLDTRAVQTAQSIVQYGSVGQRKQTLRRGDNKNEHFRRY